MRRIGIIVAMTSEYGLVKSLLEQTKDEFVHGLLFTEGRIGNVEVILAKSGIGKVCAAVGAMEMIQRYAPDVIVNTGVAGGIDPLTQVMDIVVGENMVYHDVWCGEGNEYGQVQGLPARFVLDKELCKLALSVAHDGHVYGGLICSGDKFITDKEELTEIKKRFPEGMAVDMESCAIAQVCYMRGVPFLSYRIISDTPGVRDHYKQYLNFWEEAPKRSFEMIKVLITALSEE